MVRRDVMHVVLRQLFADSSSTDLFFKVLCFSSYEAKSRNKAKGEKKTKKKKYIYIFSEEEKKNITPKSGM